MGWTNETQPVNGSIVQSWAAGAGAKWTRWTGLQHKGKKRSQSRLCLHSLLFFHHSFKISTVSLQLINAIKSQVPFSPLLLKFHLPYIPFHEGIKCNVKKLVTASVHPKYCI